MHLTASKAERAQEPTAEPLERTTVWSFPNRGNWAGHSGSYRGNWSPHVPRNLIIRYTRPGGFVLDPMCGGGTTLVEARLLGRDAVGFDINQEAVSRTARALNAVPADPTAEQSVWRGDARHLTGIANETVDLVTLHPPYANMIRYSDNTEGDLSLMNEALFYDALSQVAAEARRVLRPNGHCAVLMGDTRRRKHVVPLSFHTLQVFLGTGLLLREHVIKIQHNTTSAARWPGAHDFLLLAHENLFIFRNPAADEPVDSSRCSKDP
ncbi:MAG: DNA methyltransferase [Nitrospiria bacterium]